MKNTAFGLANAAEFVTYCPVLGIIYWSKTGPRRKAGNRADTMDSDGYRRVRLKGRYFRAHRLAWLIHHGSIGDGVIDHIDRKRDDNRIINLRLVDHAHNAWNSSQYKNNSSGAPGVVRTRNGWQAQIGFAGRARFLGCFADFEEACFSRKTAERLLWTDKPDAGATAEILSHLRPSVRDRIACISQSHPNTVNQNEVL